MANKLVYSKIRIDEAEKSIIDELNRRCELIKKCQSTIEKNTKMDLTLFHELEKIQTTSISSYDLERKVTEAINIIYLVKNDYPKIEEKKDFRETLRKLNESDTKIDAAKSFYNKNNNKLVTLLKKFPYNLVAMTKGIKIQPYYEGKDIFNEDDDGIKI